MFRTATDILIDETDLSTDVDSEIIDCANLYGISMHAVATGTISGDLFIEVSNDGVNFVSLASPTIAVSNTTNLAVQLTEVFYRYIRINYTASSGTTNTLKVYVTLKGM